MIVILALIFTASVFAQNLIVLNKSENNAMIFDLRYDKLLAKIPTGEAPHEVAISPDKKFAVITNYGTRENPGNTLTLINLERLTVEKTINLENYRRPHGVAWIDNDKVIITAEANKSIVIVDVKIGQIIKSIQTEQDISHMLALSKDAKKCFVANIASGSVSVIDLKDSKLLKNIPTGKGSEGIDITPSGDEVWVTNRAEDSIAVIDAKNFEVKKKIKIDGFPIRVKISMDGKFAVVSCARAGEIAIIDAKSKTLIKRIKTAEKSDIETSGRLFGSTFGDSPVPIGIAFADKNLVYVANSNADIISAIDIENGKIVKTIKTGKEPDGIAIW
jgi:YVTN family beta-propeller protein